MFICNSFALKELSENENIPVSETFEFTQRLESLLEQTRSHKDSDIIASHYMSGLASLCIKQNNDGKKYCSKETFERARLVAENPRYKNDDEIIDCYATILIYQTDFSNLDEVRSALKLLTDISNRPNFLDDEFFSYHYNLMKQIIENEGLKT